MFQANEKALNPPVGQCRQCWQHAYDKSIHRKLKPKENCEPCLAHMGGRCPDSMIVKG
ncbi:pRL2-8 [Streptomyces sp. NPDC048663]|uniref:pRL2-8 n=1 Tax=Streptomyces sp. NPDC048663 TaxID=3155638 RepID=UPI00341FABEF